MIDSTKKLKVAVIGLGHLGPIHARIYSELKNVELVGVCDIDKDKAKKVATAYNTTGFVNYKDLFGKVDAASIAVPTTLHFEIAKDFFNNNINLLIEKPITEKVQEAEELVRLANKNNLILSVGHVERFNSAVRALESISNNPRFIECQRLGPYKERATVVGVVLDLMIHDIDIALALVKSNIKNIEAIGVSVLSNFEDIANARITFENGAVAELTASRISTKSVRKIRIFQQDAYISLDYMKQAAFVYQKIKDKIRRQRLKIIKEEPLKAELSSFIECIINKQQPRVSGSEALTALKAALDIIDKIKQNKIISI